MATENDGKTIYGKNCVFPRALKFCQNHSISHRFRNKCAFMFYEEIQGGHQEWRENNFGHKLAEHSVHTLGLKILLNLLDLSCTMSELKVFLHFTLKFTMAAKNGRETKIAS